MQLSGAFSGAPGLSGVVKQIRRAFSGAESTHVCGENFPCVFFPEL